MVGCGCGLVTATREAVVELLQEAYVAGCLDVGELRSRAGAAYLARTWGELRALTSDLPARPAVPGPRRSHSPALLPLILLGCLGIAIIAQWPATGWSPTAPPRGNHMPTSPPGHDRAASCPARSVEPAAGLIAATKHQPQASGLSRPIAEPMACRRPPSNSTSRPRPGQPACRPTQDPSSPRPGKCSA